MKIRQLLATFPIALSLVFGGCASETSDNATPGDEAQVNATAPITLGNFLSHPTIQAIRTEVAQVDALQLTKTDNPGCDGSTSKFTEPGDKIRKIVETGGEGGFEGQQTAYYRANGSLLFLFSTESDLTGESGKDKVTTERRVYFDAAGHIVFQVARDVTGNGADWIPTGKDAFTVTIQDKPAEWFKITGCARQ